MLVMGAGMKIYLLILLLFFNTPAFAQSLAEKWRESVNGAIVYIDIPVTDSENGGIDPQIGTGFIISDDGHLLTANHIFDDWNKQAPSQKEKNIIRGRIGGKTSNDTYPLDFVGDPEIRADVVLLKLMNHSKQFPSLPLCFSNVPEGSEAVAYGFPLGQDLQPTPVTLGRRNAPGGRYAADSNFERGMSGGPVVGQNGVIGIVKGSGTYSVKVDGGDGSVIMDSAAVRWITPIQHAKNLADKVQGLQKCNSISVEREESASSSDSRAIENPAPQSLTRLKKEFYITKLQREVSNLIIDYESIDNPSDVLADKVRRQAAKVGGKMLAAPEKGVGIGHKITKYKYAAYAFMMSASYEPDLSESNELVAKGIDAGLSAASLVDELRSLDKEDSPYLVYLYSWVLEDKVDERIKYILAILYAIKAKNNDDHSIFPAVENYIKGISTLYKEERPLEKNSYLKWYLSEKNKL